MASTTTTLKLPEDLKARIAAIAAQMGKSPHAFMIEALQRETELAERRQAFIRDALLSRDEVEEQGLVYDTDAAFSYILDRLEGKPSVRPDPVKL